MRNKFLWVAGVGLACAGVAAGRSAAQFSPGNPPQLPILRPSAGGMQIYLKLIPSQGATAVVGESVDKNHPGEIAIQSYGFTTKNATSIGSATGGAGAGKASFESLQLVHTVDKTSPILFRNMCAGAHYTEAILTIRSGGIEFQKVRLKTAFVTSITQNGNAGSALPTESISMVYGGLQHDFKGSTGKESVIGGWDQVTNKAWMEAAK